MASDVPKFNVYDIIQYRGGIGTLGLIRGYDATHYYVTWLNAGESMLRIGDLAGYEKVGEIEPGTSDWLLFTGRVPFNSSREASE